VYFEIAMGYYTGKIKVVGDDKMCFPVDPETLEATATGGYDPWAWSDPDPDPVETISYGELCCRLSERRTGDRYNR
jgi:hypothetical protein